MPPSSQPDSSKENVAMPTPISKPMATPGTQGPPSAVQKGGCRPLFTASPSVSNTPLSDVGNTPRSQSSAMHSFRQARHDMECKIQDMTLIIGDLKKKLKEVTAELGQTKLANQAATSEIVQQRATIAKLQGAVADKEASNETLSKVAGKSAYNGEEAKKWRLQAHDLQAQTLGVAGAGRDWGHLKSSCTSRLNASKLGFKNMSKHGKQDFIQNNAWAPLASLMVKAGGPTEMDALMAHMVSSYSIDHKGTFSRGVQGGAAYFTPNGRKLFQDPFSMLVQTKKLYKIVKDHMYAEMKHETSVEGLQQFLFDIALPEKKVRKLEKKFPHIFHSARQRWYQKASDVAAAQAAFGKLHYYKSILLSTKEKEEAKKAKKAKTPRTRKAKRAKTTETAPSVKYVASGIRTEVVPLCTQLVKAAIVDPPECISGYDMEVHIKQVEAKCEERLSRQRKRLCEALEESVATSARKEIIKLESTKENLATHKVRASRTGTFKGKVLASTKNLTFPLVCQQVNCCVKAVDLYWKVSMDGRQVLRWDKGNREADQAVFAITLLNSGALLSAKNCHGIAVWSGGEKGVFEAKLTTLDPAAEDSRNLLHDVLSDLAKLRDLKMLQFGANSPAIVEKPSACGCLGCTQPVAMTCLPCNNHIGFTLDLAAFFKVCDGPCGPNGGCPCPICSKTRTQKDGGNMGHVFVLKFVECSKPLAVAAAECGMSVDQLLDANDADSHATYSQYTGKGMSTKTSAIDSRCPHFMKQDVDSGALIGVATGRSTKQVLLRVRWQGVDMCDSRQCRPLIQEFRETGWSWNDFCICAMHGDMRCFEKLIKLLYAYSERSVGEINNFLEVDLGCKCFKVEEANQEIQHPTVHSQATVQWFFEEERWQQLVAFADSSGGNPRADTQAVWATYERQRTLLNATHPSPEAVATVHEVTFAHFLAFRLRYPLLADVSLYTHMNFDHSPQMVETFKGVGGRKNQQDESLHSDDKDGMVCCTRTGLGNSLHAQVMARWVLKAWYACRAADVNHRGLDLSNIITMDYAQVASITSVLVPGTCSGNTTCPGAIRRKVDGTLVESWPCCPSHDSDDLEPLDPNLDDGEIDEIFGIVDSGPATTDPSDLSGADVLSADLTADLMCRHSFVVQTMSSSFAIRICSATGRIRLSMSLLKGKAFLRNPNIKVW